jgi:phosphomevalonate kinase
MNIEKILTAHAPGKLILLGEYAVLEGAPALVTAVDRFAHVEVRTGEPGSKSFSVEARGIPIPELSFCLDETGTPRFGDVSEDMLAALKFFSATFSQGLKMLQERKIPGLRLFVDTGDFFNLETGEKLGFGSSAAMTVALLAAMQGAAGILAVSEEDRSSLFRTGMDAHCLAQGKTGSGTDIAAATWGGTLLYQVSPLSSSDVPNAPAEPIEVPADLHLLTVWTGKPASTRELVGNVQDYKSREPERYRRAIDEMAAVAAAGVHAFTGCDTAAFLRAVADYGSAMQHLGEISDTPVYSAEHRELAHIVHDAGAIYKPSGSGGGDAGIVLAPSPEIIQRAASAIHQAGFKLLNSKIAARGVRIEREGET